MLEGINKLLHSHLKDNEHNKEEKNIYEEFSKTVINDLDRTIQEAETVLGIVETTKSKEMFSDEFVLNKLANEIQSLEHHLEKMRQTSNKIQKQLKLVEIYKAYKLILKAYRYNVNIKEYVYRIREDRLLHKIREISQYS